MKSAIVAMVLFGLVAQAQPVITQQPADQVVANGGTAVFSVVVSNTGPVSYQWQFNGTNLQPLITTVAGNGVAGNSGEGGAATSAELNYPYGVAVDGAGSLFIADYNNNRIRKIDTNGIITTVAGNGNADYFGDGGAATNAHLNSPSGVALDSAGNLFIADLSNYRIRKVDTNGIISTVAGNGNSGYSGDGGAATNARFFGPRGVAVDKVGNLFVADYFNNRIRKVGTNGIITTVAGKGTGGNSGDGGAATNAMLHYPYGVAVDGAGNLFIADYLNYRIREVGTNGIITTVAGKGTRGYSGDGGVATNAGLYYPSGVAVDSSGNLFIADTYNHCVRKVDMNNIITTVAGNGTAGYTTDGGAATNASLAYPNGVSADGAGNLLIADTDNHRIRKVYWVAQPTLTLPNVNTNNIGNYSVAVTDSSGSVTSSVAALNIPPYIIFTPLPQTSLIGGTVTFGVVAGGSGRLNYQWALNGSPLTGATNIAYSITNASTNMAGLYSVTVTNVYGATNPSALLTVVYVSQQPASQVVNNGGTLMLSMLQSDAGIFFYQWQLNGTNLPAGDIITTVAGNGSQGYFGDGGAATNAMLSNALGMAVDTANQLFFADSGSQRVRKVDTHGIITTVAGNGIPGYSGDGGAATNGWLNNPTGVAIDSAENLFIADNYNARIRKVDTNGIITTVAGIGTNGYSGDGAAATNAMLNYPVGVTVDGAGDLFILDRNNQRIRKVDTNGIITTVAGNGVYGYSSDGSVATNAMLMLTSSYGVAVDGVGNLFIPEHNNNRIRKVDTNGIITTVAGNGTAGYSGDGGAATNVMLSAPWSLAADATGIIYIADLGNNRIRMVRTNGIITTVAGNGTRGYSGDGGAAISAGLSFVYGVAVDATGNLFIADLGNNRIRMVVGPTISPNLPFLMVPNCSSANAGNYTLVISNYSGSITSSVATVTVLLPPQNFTIGVAGSGVQLQLTGTPNYPYILQAAASLAPPVNWQAIVTNSTDASGNWSCVLTNTANAPAAFYRAVGQ